MKRVLCCMFVLTFMPRVLVAQAFDVSALLGEWWYGLYFNGQKAGFARSEVRKEPGGDIVVEDDAQFRVSMAGVNQDMAVFSARTYAADGSLRSVASRVKDPAGASAFNAQVMDGELHLESNAGGVVRKSTHPKPLETLSDALRHARWVVGKPQPGDRLAFSEYEPMYARDIAGASEIVAVETRVFEGVPTTIYRIKTTLDMMGIESESVVAQDGTLLEDHVAGMITMRLEPEDIAKDVTYSNDVIVSNAAMIDAPIPDARTRARLALRLRGPLTEDHLFNDARQHIAAEGKDAFLFSAQQVSLKGLAPVTLPVENPETLPWRQATAFVQSDEPRLIAKAKEILAGETGARRASDALCAWVHANVRSTFSARLTNALEVLDSLEGDCTEHSILFIALARAAGLPAREVAGLIYVDAPKPGFYFHQWAKVWIGEWIDVDPTFDQPLADVTHVKLAEGDPFQQARLIPIIGNLDIEVLGDAEAKAAQAAAGAAAARDPSFGGLEALLPNGAPAPAKP